MAVSNAVAALLTEYERFAGTEMKDLFAADGERAQKYTLTLGELTYDYSKNRFDAGVLAALFNLAREHNLKDRIEDMFTGKKSTLPKTARCCIRRCAIFRADR